MTRPHEKGIKPCRAQKLNFFAALEELTSHFHVYPQKHIGLNPSKLKETATSIVPYVLV